jgi:membrane protein DedA with SNARE-associated domain
VDAGATLAINYQHLVATYGYPGVGLLVGLESVGIPLPGETVLIAAATYAGATHHLSVWGIWAVAVAGAVLGDNIGFWIGHTGGYKLLRRFGHYLRINEPELKVARYLFDRHGAKVVFFGRFVSVLRTFAAFLAGTAKMAWRKFLPYNMAGGLVWSAIYTFIAYFAGKTLSRVSGTLNWVVGGVAVVVVVTFIVLVRRKVHQLVEVAEAAYPGPLEG